MAGFSMLQRTIARRAFIWRYARRKTAA